MKKRIILITNAFPFGKGEASFILPELEALKDNYDFTIISRNSKEEQTSELTFPVDIYRYNSSISSKQLLKSLPKLFSFEVLKEVFKYIASPKKVVNTIKFVLRAHHFSKFAQSIREKYDQDVVYYTYWNDYATYGLVRFNKNKSDKIISRIHGGDLYLRPTNNYCLPLKKYIADNIDKLIFISQNGKDYYVNTFKPCDSSKLVVSRMGTDDTDVLSGASNDGVLRVLSLSNITFGKRVDRIAEVLSEVNGINIEWTHIGDGEEESLAVGSAHKYLDNKENVKYNFLGRLPNSEVREYLKKNCVDVLLNVSYSEGLPVSMMEAASFGIPVIATNVGAVGEIVSSENGFLINRDFENSELVSVLANFSKLSEDEIKSLRQNSRIIWEDSYNSYVNYQKFKKEIDKLWES